MRASYCLSACVLCLLCSAVCSAQEPPADCVGILHSTTYQCDGPNNCHSQIVTHTGESGDYYQFATVTLKCCGQLFSSIDPVGDCTFGALRKDPGMSDQIYRAAKNSPMLIADCRGRYVLYDYDKESALPAARAPSPAQAVRKESGR